MHKFRKASFILFSFDRIYHADAVLYDVRHVNTVDRRFIFRRSCVVGTVAERFGFPYAWQIPTFQGIWEQLVYCFNILHCIMSAFLFNGRLCLATYDFPGRDKLFGLLLATMMIPFTAGIILLVYDDVQNALAQFLLGTDHSGMCNAFGIFWMRQYCQNNVPVGLREAARIDGCSEWTIFFRVIMPILKPAYAALGIMQFVNTWNDFM